MPKDKTVLVSGVGMYAHERIEFAMIDRGYDMIALIADPDSIEHAQKLKDTYVPKGKKVIVQKVPAEDYFVILSTTLKLLQSKDLRGHDPEFYVGLGTRFITLALSQAAMLTQSPMFLVTIKDHETKIPDALKLIPTLPNLSLSQGEKKMLEVLVANKGHMKSITALKKKWREEMDLADMERTTTGNKVAKRLSDWGLLERRESESSGREKEVYITTLGETVRAWKGIKGRK